MRIRALVIVILAALEHNAYAQRLTLPELARLHAPEPLIQSSVSELVVVPLEQSLAEADSVVYGTVAQKADSYLSPDKMNIFTDYTVTPVRLIRQRVNVPSSTPGPQRLSPMVVKQWGGHMVIDGVDVTQVNENQRSLTVGEEVVLLLAYDRSDKKYVLGSPTWAFLVKGAKITPFVKRGALERFEGMTVSQFEAEVQRSAGR
jgi:hypothetical protein